MSDSERTGAAMTPASTVRALPDGTITLFFYGLESSAQILQALGDRYLAVLQQQRQIVRRTLARWEGTEVEWHDDELFAVFTSATSAVRAAAEVQRALSAHDWPGGVAVRGRIALHTGEPHRIREGYAGLDVHLAARLLHLTGAGQIVMTRTTRDLVQHRLHGDLQLHPLGEYRLRDIPGLTAIFQIVVPGLPVEPPRIAAEPAAARLPSTRRAVIGREREIAEARALILEDPGRLLTLTGPGGCGKTTLALRIGHEIADDGTLDVAFVSLAAVNDPRMVLPTIGRELRLRDVPGVPLAETLAGAFAVRPTLLVLDNLEQIVEAAEQIAELIRAVPSLRVLATSREVLRLSGEIVYPVGPLPTPEAKARLTPAEALASPAVRLFVERATAQNPRFKLTAANAANVAEICRRLDGLPLAIELAASRVRLLPPGALLARLGRRLAVLTAGPRDLPQRHQTLRSTILWSYDLLSPSERRLFEQVAVFAGGCTLQAAEIVCAPAVESGTDVLDSLVSLLEKSLLHQETDDDGEMRIRMIETIRELALEKLEADGDLDATRRRHAEYFALFAEEIEPELSGPGQPAALRRLEQELDNLRLALAWAAGWSDRDLGTRLGAALWRFWSALGYLEEGRGWLAQLVTPGGEPGLARVRALFGAGRLAWEQGDYEAALAPLHESLTLARSLNDPTAVAAALIQLGHVARSQGDYQSAEDRYREGLAIRRDQNDRAGVAQSLGSLGNLELIRGNHAAARRLYSECLESLQESGDPRDVVNALQKLGEIAQEQGDDVVAQVHFTEGLRLAAGHGNRRGVAYLLEGLAGLAATQQRYERALRLAGAAGALRREIGAPAEPATQRRIERRLGPAREALGERASEAIWKAGEALTLDDAVAEALG